MRRTTVGMDGGPAATGYYVPPFSDVPVQEPLLNLGAMDACGGLASTAADLAKWAMFVANPIDEVLSKDTLDEMCQVQIMADMDRWQLAFGLGFMILRRGDRFFVGHDGGMPGHITSTFVHRESGTAGIALFGATSSPAPSALATDLVIKVLEDDPLPTEPGSPAPRSRPSSPASSAPGSPRAARSTSRSRTAPCRPRPRSPPTTWPRPSSNASPTTSTAPSPAANAANSSASPAPPTALPKSCTGQPTSAPANPSPSPNSSATEYDGQTTGDRERQQGSGEHGAYRWSVRPRRSGSRPTPAADRPGRTADVQGGVRLREPSRRHGGVEQGQAAELAQVPCPAPASRAEATSAAIDAAWTATTSAAMASVVLVAPNSRILRRATRRTANWTPVAVRNIANAVAPATIRLVVPSRPDSSEGPSDRTNEVAVIPGAKTAIPSSN